MENGIQRFEFEGQEVRVTVEGDAVWFCAADVCARLEHSNTTMALAGLEDDEKGLRIVETLGGGQQLQHVTEAGLYRLVMRSSLPKAKPFQRWVTHDVLPAIRRTGSYSTPETREQLIARALLESASVIAERDATISALKAKTTEDAPKVAAFHTLMDATGLVPVTTAGKAFGVRPRLFFDWMERMGHVYKRGRNLLARQDHVDAERMHHVTSVVGPDQRQEIRAKLTPKGIAYFAERIEQFRAATIAPPRRRHLPPAQRPLLALPKGQHP